MTLPLPLPPIDRLPLWDRLAAVGKNVSDTALPICACDACRAERARRAPEEEAAAAADITRVLFHCLPYEVTTIRAALARGLVDGRCIATCLVGIVAAQRSLTYADLAFADKQSPFEHWATRVQFGMTPTTSGDAARLDSWLAAWLEAHTLELAVAVLQE